MKKVLIGILVLFSAGLCFLNLLDDRGGQENSAGYGQGRHLVILGDGRAEELAVFSEDEETVSFMVKSGADVNWLDEEALPTAAQSADESYVICVMTGVSDMENAARYVDCLNEWGRKLSEETGARLCFDSINPVAEGVFSPVNVVAFNKTVRDGLGEYVYYIDTFSKMSEKGFSTTDSLHYTGESSKLLYDLLMQELENMDQAS